MLQDLEVLEFCQLLIPGILWIWMLGVSIDTLNFDFSENVEILTYTCTL